MNNAARGIERIVSPLSRIAEGAGRVVLAVMVLLITVDVVLRYFFNRPIKGSYELIEFMLVFIVFTGLAYTQTKTGHITIDLLTSRLSKRLQAVINSATHFLCLGAFILVTWRSIVKSEILRAEGTTSGLLFIPNFPFMWVVAFGSALLCLFFLIDLIDSVSNVRKLCKKPFLWLLLDSVFVLVLVTFPLWFQWLPWEIGRAGAGLFGILLMLLLLFSQMSVGPVLALVGFLGFSYLVNPDASLALMGTSPFRTASSHAMSTIPLFVLMGVLCFYAEMSREVYGTLRTWMGRMPGGLAMATVGGCAGFAAVTGSSLATNITMGTISLPEMKRNKYSDSLATGSIAAGGSIGILIPPSIPFIIYAGITEESIGKLFIAGIIPGLMEALLYIIAIYALCKIRPRLGPPGPSSTFREKIISLKDTWGIIVLFILVIGGIYGGIFTPTEAAGIGASGAFLIGILKRKLSWKKISTALGDAINTSAMLFLMLIGASIFGYFLTRSQIPFMLSDFVVSLNVPGSVTILAILLVYVILGCIMPIIPAIILTVPIFFPVVTELGYNLIWFGVLVVTMAEIGQITPPFGMNVFVLQKVAKDVPVTKIFRGIVPFLIVDAVRIFLIFLFPSIALYLPSLME
jgi:tripartite ATP-independent transporter DctM subunit